MHHRVLFLFSLCSAAVALQAETRVWLDELDLTTMTCGWERPRAKASVAGNPSTVDGKRFERGVGTKPNYNYSPALKNFEHEQWSPELIDKWLVEPQGFVPGTAMFFPGLKEPTDRRDLIAYLQIESRR